MGAAGSVLPRREATGLMKSWWGLSAELEEKHLSFPGGSDAKASACNAGDPGLIPVLGRSPGEGIGNPLPVFLPGESHGWRSLVGYSPRGRKESETTERLHFQGCEVWTTGPQKKLSSQILMLIISSLLNKDEFLCIWTSRDFL